MKLTYFIDSLSYKGGAERIISEKMNYLSALDGYEVSVITCYQFPDTMPNSYYLSDRVRQINLCIPAHRQYQYSYPKRFWVKWHYHRMLLSKLQEAVDAIDPDILTGVSYSLGDVVCRVRCRGAIVIESHEARFFTASDLLYKQTSNLSKTFTKFYRSTYLRTIEKYADTVVTLTESDALEWRKAKRVVTIPNFSSMPISRLSDGNSKRIIAVGRFEWQKGYDRLTAIWRIVSDTHPDWQLDIYGEGSLKNEFVNSVKENGLRNVAVHDFTTNISDKYAESSICILTSRFEGFSLVLLEALRHGLPCVTFNCPFGPGEVVDDNRCGYVVEDGNIGSFAERLCSLMDSHETRKLFAAAAIEKAKVYDKDAIMDKWISFYKSMTKGKH